MAELTFDSWLYLVLVFNCHFPIIYQR